MIHDKLMIYYKLHYEPSRGMTCKSCIEVNTVINPWIIIIVIFSISKNFYLKTKYVTTNNIIIRIQAQQLIAMFDVW